MLIQALFPRDSVGQHVSKAWVALMPLLRPREGCNADQHYSLPRGSLAKLTRGNTRKFGQYFDDRRKSQLFTLLTRDLGLGVRVSKILISQKTADFLRIEEFISGFIDSLWLADHSIFTNHKDNKEISLIKLVIRKIFKVGATNRSQLIDWWKEFTNFLFHKVAETETIGGPVPNLKQGNLFARLFRLKRVDSLLKGEDKEDYDLCSLAHLVSTRQMPYMGSETEDKSLLAFEEVVTSTEGLASHAHCGKLRLAAARIGRICRKMNRKRPILDESAHISVNTSGERTHSIRDGGNVQAVREAMDRILTVVPSEDKVEETPFGPAVHKSGIPLWRTLYRTEDSSLMVRDKEWLGHRHVLKKEPGLFWGLDSNTGKQLMYCAWKESLPLPELRAEVVPEMGNKARIVTISDYWLNILQEPLAHMMIEAMRFHPSVFSSFSRQDQAWAATEMIAKSAFNPSLHSVISSDLKDATNAQQFEVTKSLIRGFLHGYGEVVNPDYLDLVIGTIGPRLIWFPRLDRSILTTKGIMMGEAIAKPSLTLLNLSIEELTFLEFTKTESCLYTTDPSPYRDWRCCHIGGDDHIAIGPINYLRGITRNHVASGSHISPGKHGYSQKAVKYTEKVLDVRRFSETDRESIIIDSVKVRLLERGQSTMLMKDNKNVAVGKSQQLANTIQWLPSSCYPEGKVQSIRNLFIKRMGELLPREHRNPRAFAAIHLPHLLGGYGLGGKEVKKYLMNSPWPHKLLISKMIDKKPVADELKLLSKLNRNPTTRGVPEMEEYERDLKTQVDALASEYHGISWKEFRSKFPSDNPRHSIAQGHRAGWLSSSDLARKTCMGTCFSTLLMGGGTKKQFRTTPWVSTYRYLYPKLLELIGEYTEPDWDLYTNAQLDRLIQQCNKTWYFDINEKVTFDLGQDSDPRTDLGETFDFVQAPLVDGIKRGHVDLSVGKHFIGWKGKPRTKFLEHFDDEDSDEEFDLEYSAISRMMSDEFQGISLPQFEGILSDDIQSDGEDSS